MPIYEYRCDACGFQNEYLQRVGDAPKTVCPQCGQQALRKLLSAAGFQLKGTGWYATDFKNSGRPADKKDKDSRKEGSEGSGSRTDATCGAGACPACSD